MRTTWLQAGLLALGLLTTAAASAAGDLLDTIKQKGEIAVGMEGTYPPFNYVGDDGKLTGFEVDFAHALARHLGVKVVIKPTKWDGILGALSSGRIDMVINQVAPTDERKKAFDFSQPYTVSGIQALAQKAQAASIKSPADLQGKRVGVGLGTNYEEWLRAHVQGVDVRTYDDDPSKYQDLLAGRTDAILIDRLAALEFVKKTGDKLALAGPPFSRQPTAIALRKGNPHLLAAVNNAITHMREDGSLAGISQKWFGEDVSQ